MRLTKCLNKFLNFLTIKNGPKTGVGNLLLQSHTRLFEPPVVAPFEGKQRPFLGIIFGITEVFGPDDSFAAPGEFRIVTNGRIRHFKCKRLPTPGLQH